MLDGETIALKPDGTPYPFQETMRRFGRKLDVEAVRRRIRSASFSSTACSRGRGLHRKTTRERFRRAREISSGEDFIPRLVPATRKRQPFTTSARARPRGVMAKALEPRTRREAAAPAGSNQAAHTLDLGRHRRRMGQRPRKGWLSNLHLAALDPPPAASSCSARRSRA